MAELSRELVDAAHRKVHTFDSLGRALVGASLKEGVERLREPESGLTLDVRAEVRALEPDPRGERVCVQVCFDVAGTEVCIEVCVD